jgi:ABC-type multidrug transport system ATPase subunit
MVLNSVSIELQKGEIFGVLGGGGSGKTTMMEMLAGELVPTQGTVCAKNASLIDHRIQYMRNIGYCPQGDALFDTFTGIEMMELMGKLKGVPSSLLASHVKKWLHVLGKNFPFHCSLQSFPAKLNNLLMVGLIFRHKYITAT